MAVNSTNSVEGVPQELRDYILELALTVSEGIKLTAVRTHVEMPMGDWRTYLQKL